MTLNGGADERYLRFQAIQWWDQKLLQQATVLVIGAGALGNEVLKNLALLGIGRIVVVDMDTVERSNLSRAVLFREAHEKLPKVECAARMLKEINPYIQVVPVQGNVIAEVGLGYFHKADVVIGALDNREARVFINSVCARLQKPWIDGGIEVLQGIVRGFAAPATACYECTMSKGDWQQINQRRSCSLLAKLAVQNKGVPTTPTTAAVIGGIQAQETVKILHGLPALRGQGWFFDGQAHNSYRIEYQVLPDCPWHQTPPPVQSFPVTSATPLKELAALAAGYLGGFSAFDLVREHVQELSCVRCGETRVVFKPEELITREELLCKQCGSETVPVYFHTIAAGSSLLEKSPRELGFPAWDILRARYGEESLGMLMAGDDPFKE